MKGQNKGYEKPFFFYQTHTSLFSAGAFKRENQQKAVKMARNKKRK